MKIKLSWLLVLLLVFWDPSSRCCRGFIATRNMAPCQPSRIKTVTKINSIHITSTSTLQAAQGVSNKVFLGGALSGAVSKFLIGPKRAKQVLWKVGRFALDDWMDWLLIGLCIKLPVPLAKQFYKIRMQHLELSDAQLEQKFMQSKTRRTAQLITEVGDLFGFLFSTELVLVLLGELGFHFVDKYPVHTWATGIVAAIWAAKSISEFKRYLISRAYQKDKESRTKAMTSNGAKLLNRVLDVFIVVATSFGVLDFLSVKTGLAIQSIVGLSSIGTLVFSLASQNLASEFLASLAIQSTNMYEEGDWIVLKDGSVAGAVQKLGWLNTHIRTVDESIIRVPNTHIAGERLANVSRQKLSSVNVKVEISYDEIDKVPELVEKIRNNLIDLLGPDVLIMDGSRPFRVHWREMTEYSIIVVVDTHLRIIPFSDIYWDTRQAIFLTVTKAAKDLNIKFSYKDKNRIRSEQNNYLQYKERTNKYDEDEIHQN